MNFRKLTIPVLMLFGTYLFSSCSHSENDVKPCTNGPAITVDETTASTAGSANGKISVSATGGTSPYTFSIDGTNFQSNGLFDNMAAGEYTITVQDANGCTNVEMASIKDVPVVSYATDIRPIIDANCQISPCHGTNTSIPSWATYNDIKTKAGLIKTKTANKSMPKVGSLTDAQIKLIGDWVDQGAPNN